MTIYDIVAIGGTFDHLHHGHKKLLDCAFSSGRHILIGVTSDHMAMGKVPQHPQDRMHRQLWDAEIQRYDVRVSTLHAYLASHGWTHRCNVVKIEDVYGPLVDRDDVDALVVSPETIVGGRMINAMRRSRGKKTIRLVCVPFTLAQDRRKISSTRIRSGDINRDGIVYRKMPIFGKRISESVRVMLKNPLGEVVPDVSRILNQVSDVITVGDVVTKTVNEIDAEKIDIAIVDYRVNRFVTHASLGDVGFSPKMIQKSIVTSVKNPPGCISLTLANAVHLAYKSRSTTQKRQIIRVIGEEDLAGVPAILFAPLGSTVLYGQPPSSMIGVGRSKVGGVVVVHVTEEKKEKLMHILAP